jgi:hypothetical protein
VSHLETLEGFNQAYTTRIGSVYIGGFHLGSTNFRGAWDAVDGKFDNHFQIASQISWVRKKSEEAPSRVVLGDDAIKVSLLDDIQFQEDPIGELRSNSSAAQRQDPLLATALLFRQLRLEGRLAQDGRIFSFASISGDNSDEMLRRVAAAGAAVNIDIAKLVTRGEGAVSGFCKLGSARAKSGIYLAVCLGSHASLCVAESNGSEIQKISGQDLLRYSAIAREKRIRALISESLADVEVEVPVDMADLQIASIARRVLVDLEAGRQPQRDWIVGKRVFKIDFSAKLVEEFVFSSEELRQTLNSALVSANVRSSQLAEIILIGERCNQKFAEQMQRAFEQTECTLQHASIVPEGCARLAALSDGIKSSNSEAAFLQYGIGYLGRKSGSKTPVLLPLFAAGTALPADAFFDVPVPLHNGKVRVEFFSHQDQNAICSFGEISLTGLFADPDLKFGLEVRITTDGTLEIAVRDPVTRQRTQHELAAVLETAASAEFALRDQLQRVETI